MNEKELMVRIDFSPVRNDGMRLSDFANAITVEDLRAATDEMLNVMREIIEQATDAQVVYLPYDPEADDPHAVPGEEHIGWSLAHLAVHCTASMEEGAAHSSILARGIPYVRDPRLRYETHWSSILTAAQTLQRLEESRRMCHAFLDTWPDEAHLDVYRDVSERFLERHGKQNATVAYLSGLMHYDGHLDQFRKVYEQAKDDTEVRSQE
jgi:hypothetical protein